VARFDLMLVEVLTLYSCGVTFCGLSMASESFTPVVGGAGVVARGFKLVLGASEGCGGGVARWILSRKT